MQIFLFSIKFNYVTRKNIFLLCIENIMQVCEEHFARDFISIWVQLFTQNKYSQNMHELS